MFHPSVDVPLKEGVIPAITLGMPLAHWLHPLIWHLGQSRASVLCPVGLLPWHY